MTTNTSTKNDKNIPEELPTFKLGIGTKIISCDDIYSRNSWLNE